MLTDWKIDYKNKKVSVEAAIEKIKSGDRIVVGHAAGEPITLIDELGLQIDRLEGAEIIHMIALGKAPYCKSKAVGHIKHNSFFAGPGSRKAIREKRADFTAVFFSEIPRLFMDKVLPVNVALIHVSPPNEKGFCSYGVSVDYAKAAADSADLVIAEVNEQMPYTYGSYIHVSEIDFLVESNVPLIEIPRPQITDIERQIGQNIATLIPDRANLQLGIGAIPDAVLLFLKGKKDLGIHTEMMSDGVVELYEAEVVTNKFNNLHPGKFTACFLLGTKKLYDFAHKNPAMNMQPVDYTNKVTVAGKVDNLISINSAIEVDLFGQVCADTMGYQQFSGVGGQVDFVRATSLSKGGKSVIALPSTAKDDEFSRIVSKFKDGACVTTTRNDVQFIVTEYGIADLRGKTNNQRMESLIAIAHPKFREKLHQEWLTLTSF